MKTKPIIIIAFAALLLASCIKDYVGHSNEKVELTADNYLYEGNLERLFLTEKVIAIDVRIKELEEVEINHPKYNDAQAEIVTLSKDRDDSKQQISLNKGIEQVFKDFPIPCDGFPNGKCVPVRMEYFVISKFVKEALLVVMDSKGRRASANLVDLPGFEDELQYIRIPIFDDGNGIRIKFFKKDVNGGESVYNLDISNK